MAQPLRPVDPRASFPELEERVLERWREREVFDESVRRRRDSPPWGFYEGPPTANGPPGSHHVLARVFKDIFPRFKTMRGFYVERKGGWDCHGLPVELAVEAELGFTSKGDIERYGIAEFNARCRKTVLSHVEDWTKLTERIGFWIDTENAYRTLDTDYIESVWWALKTIHEKGLLYERLKVVPYCTRDETTLSSHELGQPDVYRDVLDPSVYVRLPVREAHGAAHAGDELLVWTTTPWTLVSNAAVAVDPELIYVRARSDDGPVFILAEELLERVLGGADILSSFPGSELEGVRYEPPFAFIPGSAYGELGHSVLIGDFVTADEGTGLVHTAIAFGDDDFRLGEQYGLNVINPVRLDGTFDERIGPYAGRYVKDADPDLIEDLRARGRLLRAETIEHTYPHCWRCGTPLLYYAKPSWYIGTSQIKDRLLASNESVNWHPEHVKHGRFGKWLEGNVDWALSRERYWGTPLPVWQCANEHAQAIGSFEELGELSGVTLTDPHRPFVDEVTFPCPECGEEMRRVPEVIDVWFDSGSMPFAQYHAPHENLEQFRERFPADFICEALDQTRGWFYSLLAVSTLLFDRSSYRNVVCLGLILDDEGRKMSKSLGNVVAPWDVIDRYGADAFRWYLFTSKQPWDGYRFSLETIGEAVRQFLLQLWNTYSFYVLYANANEMDRVLPLDLAHASELDRWAFSRLQATTETVIERLDEFDATTAGRAIAAFVDELSNWYVRRSRRRFWDGDPVAFGLLRECMLTVAKLLAPFCPFLADEIYDNLDGAAAERAPVRLPDASRARPRARASDGDGARDGAARPRRARPGEAQGPPAAARSGRRRDRLRARGDRAVRRARARGAQRARAAVRVRGRRARRGRGQAQLPDARAAVRQADAARGRGGRGARPRPRRGGAARGPTVAISVGGQDHIVGAEDLLVSMKPLEGYQVEREGSHAVALELEIDDELRDEGWAREIVHAVQAARRDAGLEVTDRIVLTLDGDPALLAAARAHERYIAAETLAVQVGYESLNGVAPVEIDGRELRVAVALA